MDIPWAKTRDRSHIAMRSDGFENIWEFDRSVYILEDELAQ
jgi:hypothetical protein